MGRTTIWTCPKCGLQFKPDIEKVVCPDCGWFYPIDDIFGVPKTERIVVSFVDDTNQED